MKNNNKLQKLSDPLNRFLQKNYTKKEIAEIQNEARGLRCGMNLLGWYILKENYLNNDRLGRTYSFNIILDTESDAEINKYLLEDFEVKLTEFLSIIFDSQDEETK